MVWLRNKYGGWFEIPDDEFNPSKLKLVKDKKGNIVKDSGDKSPIIDSRAKFKNGMGKTDLKDGLEENVANSIKDHTVNGKLTPEREALHKQIIDEYFAGKNPVNGQATFYMSGGGSASGKGTLVKHPEEFMNQSKDCVVVDSDDIKRKFPEWDDKDYKSAGYLHEESSALAKRIMTLARENHYDYMLDGTGDGSVNSLMKKINDARNAGYRVEASYCTADMGVALERNYQRYIKTGRLVPYASVRNTHVNVSKIFPQVANKFDHVTVYDTNTDNKTIKIAECKYGDSVTVYDSNKYNGFLDKANFTDDPRYFDDAIQERLKH